MSVILVLPKLNVQKANAFSSAYSVGFPAMTAWAGFIHSIERQFVAAGLDIKLSRFGVVSYNVDVNRYRYGSDRFFSLKDQGKPLKGNAERESTVESATCSLTVSLIVEVISDIADEIVVDYAMKILSSKVKCCSGDIIKFHKPWIKKIETNSDWYWLRKVLMPGYIIVSQHSIFKESMEETQDAISSIIQSVAIHHKCMLDKLGGVHWTHERLNKGWIVPMGVGFGAISELKEPKYVMHSRDNVTPHCFVESLMTLCEFKLTYRLSRLEDCLWKTQYDQENEFYLVCQD